LLDRTQPDPSLNPEGASPALVLDNVALDAPPAQGWQRPLGWLRRAGQFFFALSFSSLTRRIVSLNLAGLVALVASILYLSQFRAGLIDARAQSCWCRPRSSPERSQLPPPSRPTPSPSIPTGCSI
jgi:two-component system sensor histidine kinase ChvG